MLKLLSSCQETQVYTQKDIMLKYYLLICSVFQFGLAEICCLFLSFLATGACAEHGTAWEFPHLLWWESPWRSRRSRDTTPWETGGFQADTCLPVSWQIPILCMRGPYPSPVLLILLEMHGEAKLCETILLRSWLINAHYRSMFSPWGLISGFAMRLSCEMRIS